MRGLETKRRILKAIGEELTLKDSVLEIKPRTPFLMIKEVIEKHGIKPIIGPKDYAQYEPIKIPMSLVGGWSDLLRTQMKEFVPITSIPNLSAKYNLQEQSFY